jgi:hypothetical protein
MSDEKVVEITAPPATIVGDLLTPGEGVDAVEPPLLNQPTCNPALPVEEDKIHAVCIHASSIGVPLLLKNTQVSSQVDKMYVDMTTEINKQPLTKETLWPTVLRAMERIDTVKDIQGVSKKEWVLVSMQKIIKQHPRISEDDRVALLHDLITLVPLLLDEFMKVAKGVYKLASEVQATGCFGCCSVKSKKLKMQK